MTDDDSAEPAHDPEDKDKRAISENEADGIEQGIGAGREETRTPARRHVVKAASALLGGAAAGAMLQSQPAAADVPPGSVMLESFHDEAKDPAPNDAGARTLGTGPNQAAPGDALAGKASTSGDTFTGPVTVDPPGNGISTINSTGFVHHATDANGPAASVGNLWGLPVLGLHNSLMAAPTAGVFRVLNPGTPTHADDLTTKSHVDNQLTNIRARDTDPHDYVEIGPNGENGKAGILAALEAAELAGGRGVVRLRPGQPYLIDGTLAMSGFSSSLVGAYPASQGSRSNTYAVGTVLRAVNQTGPVLDFTGFRFPGQFLGKIDIGGFTVEGDNTPGEAKVGILINGSAGSIWMHDIVIMRTGGIALDVTRFYLSEMDRVVMGTPVGAYENDVPYLALRACNCSSFNRLGFRSLLDNQDVGQSGAAIITDDGSNNGHDNLFTGWWFEYLHPGQGATMVHHEGYMNMIRDFQFVDCSSTWDGADGTPPERNSYFRFASTHSGLNGGNEVSGGIPGRGTNEGSIRFGVEMLQNYNSIRGVKKYRGHNVLMGSDVTRSSVYLAGTLQGAFGPAVVAESGGPLPATVRVHDDWVG